MTLLHAIFLGFLQGLTEFLPVSSSGHLAIFQYFLGLTEPLMTFDVFLHLGTLVAVIIVFRKDLWALIKNPFSKEVGFLLLACIPIGIAGFVLNDFVSGLFQSIPVICIALMVTGVLMFISDRFKGQKSLKEMRWYEALVVGCFQGLAIIPGLSRSGSTIFGALLCGFKRDEAARFSFILSIPAILGASLKEFVDIIQGSNPIAININYFVGAAVAGIFGYLAIRFFLKLLAKGKMRYFAYYCWAFALIALVASFFI